MATRSLFYTYISFLDVVVYIIFTKKFSTSIFCLFFSVICVFWDVRPGTFNRRSNLGLFSVHFIFLPIAKWWGLHKKKLTRGSRWGGYRSEQKCSLVPPRLCYRIIRGSPVPGGTFPSYSGPNLSVIPTQTRKHTWSRSIPNMEEYVHTQTL